MRALLAALLALLGGAPAPDLAPWYTDVTAEAGIAFARTPVQGPYRIVNVYEGGLAVADVDGDGWEDLYLVNGALLPGAAGEALAGGNRLYRNEGDGTFTDWTGRSGLRSGRIGHGAVFADYDNDGDQDLFVTNWGGNQLFRNRGDGTFDDVTRAAGVSGWGNCRHACWSTSASFADLDNDGWLDLYATTYLETWLLDALRLPVPLPMVPDDPDPGAAPAAGMPNLLYHNRRDGTFQQVAGPLGLQDARGEGWAPGFADYDGDNDLDLFLANDRTPDRLFRNDGGLAFRDVTAAAGISTVASSMGRAWFDLDNDLDLDLVATEFRFIETTLYVNRGDATFADERGGRGLDTSTDLTGWGVVPTDADLDGDLDLFMANGDPDAGAPNDKGNLLYENLGGTFDDITAGSGAEAAVYGRGAVSFDYDNDGDEDLAINSGDGDPAKLFRNVAPRGNGLQLLLVGTASNRDAVGAQVVVRTPHAQQLREVSAGDSFEASSSRRLTIGLGAAHEAQVDVRWPSGLRESHRLPAGTAWVLTEGRGAAPAGWPSLGGP